MILLMQDMVGLLEDWTALQEHFSVDNISVSVVFNYDNTALHMTNKLIIHENIPALIKFYYLCLDEISGFCYIISS